MKDCIEILPIGRFKDGEEYLAKCNRLNHTERVNGIKGDNYHRASVAIDGKILLIEWEWDK